MQDCIDADVIKLGKYTFFCNPLDSGQKGLSQIGVSFHSASKEIGKKVSNRVMIPVFIAGHDGADRIHRSEGEGVLCTVPE